MGQAATKRLTVEEFFDWCPNDDSRWELVDGVPVAMAPASDMHAVVLSNLIVAAGDALRARPACRVRTGAGVVRPDRNDTFLIPDMLVSCAPPRRDALYPAAPLMVSEVLSPSTANDDRQIKVPIYRQIPSIREILLLDPMRMYAEVLRRLDGERLLTDLAVLPDAGLRLESIGLDIALTDLYAGLPLDEAEDD